MPLERWLIMIYGNFMPARPTTHFEVDALRYLKYDLLDEDGYMNIDRIHENGQYFQFLKDIRKVQKNIGGHVINIDTPSNIQVLCFAYRDKGKHRKVAALRKKLGCNLPPVGFKSWEHYDEYHGWHTFMD